MNEKPKTNKTPMDRLITNIRLSIGLFERRTGAEVHNIHLDRDLQITNTEDERERTILNRIKIKCKG